MDDLSHFLVVHALAGSRALVEALPSFGAHPLGPLGFVPAPELGPDHWVCPVRDEAHRLFLARELLGWGALFAEGKEWSPAELMELYWEQGKLNVGWRTVAWAGPGQPHIQSLPRRFPPASQPAAPLMPWEHQGCSVCREGARKLAMAQVADTLPSFDSSAYRHAALHRCTVCSAWWEVGDRYAAQLSEAQAQAFYPRAFPRPPSAASTDAP